MDEWVQSLAFTLASTFRVATPLILCAMAGLFSERSGVVDISLEGKLLAGAFAGAAAAAVTGSAWIGVFAAIFIGLILSLIHAFATITHRGDQVVSAVAINMLAAGLTVVLGHAWFGLGGQTPALGPEARLLPLTWPGAEAIGDIPIVGTLYRDVLSGHSLLTYVALASVPLTHWIVFRTRFGLRLRAVGENPEAVDTAGISVAWMRYRAVLIGGVLCGIAGAYLSMSQNASFVREMSAGQGFIALAALIFGKWKPLNAFLACLMFGFLNALSIRLQGVALPGIGEAPVQLIQALPFVLTVVLLAGFLGRAIPPKAIGRPYVKEH